MIWLDDVSAFLSSYMFAGGIGVVLLFVRSYIEAFFIIVRIQRYYKDDSLHRHDIYYGQIGPGLLRRVKRCN